MISEGYDLPEIDCIINLRPSQSQTFVKQMLGRGLRICNGKKNLLYIDFIWNTDKPIVSPCNFFARDDSVASSMRDFLVLNCNKSYDIMELSNYTELVVGGIYKMEKARRIAQQEIPKKGLKSYYTFAFLINDKKLLKEVQSTLKKVRDDE